MLEQSFRRNFLQHALAVSTWMQEHDAKGGIDPKTMGMEIALGDRAVRFYPQFTIQQEGQLSFVPRLQPGVAGFVGWVPNPGKGWKESSDKLAFKDFARRHGLRTPLSGGPGTVPMTDYLVKKASSTLGRHVEGPFPAAHRAAIAPGFFWEQFVRGRVVKAWYWNGELAVAEAVQMPTVTGDGKRTIAELALYALGPVAAASPLPAEFLALQGESIASVPAAGKVVQLEYRYISPFNPSNHVDQDIRAAIRGTAFEEQLVRAGRACLQCVPEDLRADTAFSIDAVLDAQDRLWLLEINCNPLLHPAFYPVMLDSLFARVAEEV
jgi:hypothetical protein